MEENINISEKIDRYVLGQMSEEEKTAFEAKLSSDSELKHEYELQREIILATQRLHFKRHLQNIEQQARLKRKRMIRTVSTWSIAAAIVCVCVIGVDMKYSSDLRDTSMLCYTETGAPLTRSDNEIDELLLQAYELIGKDEIGAASSKILAAEKIINEELKQPVTTEEEQYRKEIMLLQKQDIDWYKALILMKEGEIFKSRKALKKIASSDSRYAEQARNILETNYPF
ncbi:MAG: hypothetical protein IKV80_06220 [Bacteroidales bacterium]|nr:hypothetical protein [Bacteroidales bacterium]